MIVRTFGAALLTGLLVSCASTAESNPADEGWVDLLAAGDLKGWTRVPVPPGSELSERNPWSFDADTRVVTCKAQPKILEALRFEYEFADALFHVEFRFEPDSRAEYNSGIYFRCSPDFAIWHQAQVAQKKERPVVGDLFGNTPVGGKAQRIDKLSKVPNRARPVGEWNTMEITCRGGNLTLAVNGAVTATWSGVNYPKGYFALQAEHYHIEFRNVRYKPL